MNHPLLRFCCAILLCAGFVLGICPVAPYGAQAQERDPELLVITPGFTVFAVATEPGLGFQPQRLVSFNADSPGTLTSDVRIRGLEAGDRLVGIDFRPATGELFGVSNFSRIYRIDTTTAVATPVSAAAFAPAISSVEFFGLDFNPIPDRIRLISNVSDQNLRLNQTDGTVAGTDTNVAYAADIDPNTAGNQPDPNFGDQPNVVGAAYTNNFAGTSATTLYAIDARAEGGVARLVTVGSQNGTPQSPNGGQLFTVANLTDGTGAALQTNNLVGFDITANNNAYVSLTPINPFDAPSSFYNLNVATGAATRVGTIGTSANGSGLRVEGIAVATATTGTAPNPTNSTFAFNPTSATVAEGTASVTLTVTRTGTTTAPAQVRYITNDGTATNSMDFITAAGTLFFAAGETSRTITVLIQDDAFAENAESFTVSLLDPRGAILDAAARAAVVTITDNDAATATTNPIDNRDYFVRQQYRDFLSRDPDAQGFAFWTSQYDSRVAACSSITDPIGRQNCIASARASISLAFFVSVEFQQTGYLVYRTYDVAFARLGATRPARGANVAQTAVGFREFFTDTQTVARGIVTVNAAGEASINQAALEANTVQFFQDFVQRPAFVDRYPESLSAEGYISALFASANITPTADQRQAAVTAYGSGGVAGRAAALRLVADNDQEYQREFNRAFVLLEYFGYLRREPDITGYNFWLNKLDAASTSTAIDRTRVPTDPEALGRIRRAEIIESFIRSCEYQQRFGVPTTSPNNQPVSTQCGG